ncbi:MULTISPECIES: phage portal protein [Bacteria]|uniref:Phage portal protein, SPP1 Gp6-like n=2 Tax=Bacteria TaxID=2 RepID=A0A1I4UJW5_9BURK|nr:MULTISPECIES: phage portal protein [Bacteria]SFE68634.1 Phage portal protein, SPP1 Gp6-like [Saccharopolyspora kobensis]SFM89277.1 Phage portal protein, SPP1 Gp6-like [Rugamonas rubra]
MPTAWPPAPFDVAQRRMDEWDAWYVGNPDGLAQLYGSSVPRTRPSQYRGGLVGALGRFFWGRPTPAATRPARLHVPLASDIATASADLLFAEPPRLTVTNPAAQDRLDAILHSPLVHSGLLEAAEVAAALGGVYLRVVWDADLAAHPVIDTVHADAAVPEWRWSQLTAVTFWSTVLEDGNTVWRHLERHEPGRIVHALHAGSTTELGEQRDLREHPATAWAADVIDSTGAIATGTHRLTATYVPNLRPNRAWRGKPGLAPLGRSDFDSVEPLFDAIDEAYSSWMRDIRLAKARLIVPTGYLDNNGPGAGASFDDERELFTEINAVSRGNSGPEITLSQFAIRVAEHRETVDELVRAALRSAGYSPATFGDQDGDTSITATEVNARERISERTRHKKALHWSAGLSQITAALLDIDREVFRGPGIAAGDVPAVEFPPRSQPDPEALARTAETLYRAETASTEVRVRMVHPDWDETDVAAEVARIRSEAGAVEPDPAEILRQAASVEP